MLAPHSRQKQRGKQNDGDVGGTKGKLEVKTVGVRLEGDACCLNFHFVVCLVCGRVLVRAFSQ